MEHNNSVSGPNHNGRTCEDESRFSNGARNQELTKLFLCAAPQMFRARIVLTQSFY